jgi:hypothetical protein
MVPLRRRQQFPVHQIQVQHRRHHFCYVIFIKEERFYCC